MKYSLDNLVIECTRRCNMECLHCLRGESEDIDMDLKIINQFFKQIEYISTLTLSGGEPSLVPGLLMKIIKVAKRNKVGIDSFYMATNAKEVSDKFIQSMVQWYLFCWNGEMNDVQISNDNFHEKVSQDNIRKLEAFRFVSMKYEKYMLTDKDLIREGRAAINCDCIRDAEPSAISMDDENSRIEDTLYLNCKGDLFSSCDLSYETQDNNPRFRLGNVMDKSFDLEKAVVAYNKTL